MGLIVRTAGLNKTKNELNNDVINTIKTWEEIKKKTITLKKLKKYKIEYLIRLLQITIIMKLILMMKKIKMEIHQ